MNSNFNLNSAVVSNKGLPKLFTPLPIKNNVHLRIAIFWWSLHIFSGNSDYQPPFAAALHAFTPTSTYQLTESVKANQWVGMRHLRDSPLQGWCTSGHLSNCTSGAFRGGAGGSLPPRLFLDQTEARGAEKTFLGDRFPPPFLRVWMTGLSLIARSWSASVYLYSIQTL